MKVDIRYVLLLVSVNQQVSLNVEIQQLAKPLVENWNERFFQSSGQRCP